VTILKLSAPRTAYLQARKIRNQILESPVLSGLIAIALMLLVLNRVIADRVRSLRDQLRAIRNLGAFHKRLDISGDDELNSLASDVHEVLSSVHEARRDAEAGSAAKTAFLF
jgi:signal transduction histidine kinase